MSGTIPPPDDLIALATRLEAGVISRVTDRNDEIQDDEYRRIRKVFLQHPALAGVIPQFLQDCRSSDDLWQFFSNSPEIPSGQGVWRERRAFVRRVLAPIVDRLEAENVDLLGSYEQVQLLGTGGFGQVFEYRDRRSKQSFAIKLFDPAFAEGGESGFLERFLREAQILQALRHPNIIEVYESGQHGRRPYIRMEHFHGRDLGRHLREHGRFSPDLAVRVVRALGEGLEHAHSLGIVHRDLKPSNVMTARPSHLRIIDFGLGAFVERELTSRITRTGQALVGGHYTAPELVADPRRLDTRSDIYSVGAIWYELTTGRPPAGSTIAELLKRAEVSDSHQMALLRCLADVEERYQSVGELLADIKHL